MEYLKAFLYKYYPAENRLDVVIIPRWMTKRERECYERERQTIYRDYIFCLSHDADEIGDMVFGIGGFVSDER